MEPYSCQNSPLQKKIAAAHQLWLNIGSREKQSLEEVEMVDGHLLPLRLHIPPSNPLHSPPSSCAQSSQLTVARLPISLQQSSENMSGSKINGAGDGGLSCARQFSCLFDAISIPSSIPGRKHILVAPFKDGGLKGRECCSCSSFSSRTVMSPAAAKLHNTIYDPSILDIQISSLKSGNLTVKLQHLFYQQSRRNQWTQDSTILHHFNKFSSTHEN